MKRHYRAPSRHIEITICNNINECFIGNFLNAAQETELSCRLLMFDLCAHASCESECAFDEIVCNSMPPSLALSLHLFEEGKQLMCNQDEQQNALEMTFIDQHKFHSISHRLAMDNFVFESPSLHFKEIK